MPLIVICGVPCCGKSRIASDVSKSLAQSKGIEPIVVTDEQKLNESKRDEIYGNSSKEKELRGWLKSQIDRYLNTSHLVILDASNYIKGYRYELYCLSKERNTTHCVIECVVPTPLAWEWNQNRDESIDKYSKPIFDALVQRYEAPDSRNRWDSPHFGINYGEEIPYKQIEQSLYSRNAPPPNLATQSQPLTATNFLYELDLKTQNVINIIQKAFQCGHFSNIAVPDSKETINFNRVLSPGELGRHKRQFINYTKMHPIDDVNHFVPMFVQYLNTSNK